MMAGTIPFTHPVAVSSIRANGQKLHIVADDAERQAIARHLDLLELSRFEANMALRRDGARVLVEGTYSADVAQACVVTLEPVAARLVETVSLTFAEEVVLPEKPRADKMPELHEIEVQMSDVDPPEPIIGGRFDPAPILVELLSLALDPYPRKPGAAFTMPDDGAEMSPFAALARLRKSDKSP